MICHLCEQPIISLAGLHLHHITPKCEGGIETVATHPHCHTQHHRQNGDFRRWGAVGGQISTLDRHWAFNLRNVKTDPRHNVNRLFYRLYYAD
jgi:hypothetical protein